MTEKKLTDLEKPGVQHIVYELDGTAHGITGIPQFGMLSFSDWADSSERKVRLESDGVLGDIYVLDDNAVVKQTVRKYLDGEVIPMPEIRQPKSVPSSLAEQLRSIADQLDHTPPAGTDLRVIITGNVIEGLFIWGPFEGGAEACDWADNEFPDHEWLQVLLLPPHTKE